MNPYTGQLVRIGDDESMQRALLARCEMLPKELHADAMTALAGKTERK